MPAWYIFILTYHEPITFVVAICVFVLLKRSYTVDKRLAIVEMKLDMLLEAHRLVSDAKSEAPSVEPVRKPVS